MTDKIYFGQYTGNEATTGTKKDGTAWMQYALKFAPKPNQEYGWTISLFNPIKDTTSLKVDQLQQLKFYKVTYADSKNINPMSGKPYKQFIRIEESTPEAEAKYMAEQGQQQTINAVLPQTQIKQIDMSKYQEFTNSFKVKTAEDKGFQALSSTRKALIALSSYLYAVDKNYYDVLFQRFKAEFEPVEQPKA